jgi:TATA-binding protein-associated factor Taf7
MEDNTLIQANNLKHEMQQLNEALDGLNLLEEIDGVQITARRNLTLSMVNKAYGEILKKRYEDFHSMLVSDIEKKIKQLEKEFSKL